MPFNHLVRLSAGNETASWLDQKAKSSVHRNNLPPKSNRFKLFNTLTDPMTGQKEKWEGCVEARPHPHDIEDSSASSSNGKHLFSCPYFYPDTREPNNSIYTYTNDYLPKEDYQLNLNKNRRKKFGEYYKQTFTYGRGPNKECYIKRILPLTTDMGQRAHPHQRHVGQWLDQHPYGNDLGLAYPLVSGALHRRQELQ